MKTLRGISLSGNAAAELLSDRTASGFPLVEFDGELLESAEFERAVKKSRHGVPRRNSRCAT